MNLNCLLDRQFTWDTKPYFLIKYNIDLNILTSSSFFQFERFDLSAPSQWLEVRDGKSRESTLIGRFTGVKVDDVIISSSPSIHVHLQTGLQGRGRGFNFTYQNGL